MKNRNLEIPRISFALIPSAISLLLMGCSISSPQSGTPALFNTKIEAEKAAKEFNCTGAHQMGNKWMPCKSHEDHQKPKKPVSHGHHHH